MSSNITSRIAVCAVLALGLAGASEASGSTYTVNQCSAQQGQVSDAQQEGQAIYTLSNSCGFANGYLEARSGSSVAGGLYRQWGFSAPVGTRMTRVTGLLRIDGETDAQGNQAYMFIRDVGESERVAVGSVGAGGFSTSFDTSTDQFRQGGDVIDRIGIGVTCARAAGQSCPARNGIYSQLSSLTFEMEDQVAPAAPVVSGGALLGWVNGTETIDFAVSDVGAGVSLSGLSVNGSTIRLAGHCTPEVAGGAAKRLKPCPSTGSGTATVDVTESPFTEGANAVEVCTLEYGSNPQRTCSDETVRVDTASPAAPGSLAVDGGEGWRRDNEFDLTWSNPAQAHAPIVGATVRITGPGGFDESTYHAGAGRESIEGISVPAVGEYTASIHLRDAAGNEAPANQSSVHLRFDDTVPAKSEPSRANGWIGRADLASGYLQEWQEPRASETPPSGIAGYRVVVNINSDSDPCSGAADARTCGGQLTELGADANSRVLSSDDLVEGANYVHVAPVSGSGMRATAVGHAPLNVDLTDPTTVLQGAGSGGWSNREVSLEVVASDPVSGMRDTDEFPDDLPPATFLEVDGQLTQAPGATAAGTITAEGSHRVRYWARDLAGNEGAATPGTATVRIDRSEPEVAFTNSQDPDDPDKLLAPVSDALSGVDEGRISYREAGGVEWKSLETSLSAGSLAARVDSGDLRPGVTYEFRAIATDRAGNTAVTTSKANGEPMRVTGPFRGITAVADLTVNGKGSARVGYGRKVVVSGDLLTDDGGRPVGGATVQLVESFAAGSKQGTRISSVLTDGDGRFSAKLGRGPEQDDRRDVRGRPPLPRHRLPGGQARGPEQGHPEGPERRSRGWFDHLQGKGEGPRRQAGQARQATRDPGTDRQQVAGGGQVAADQPQGCVQARLQVHGRLHRAGGVPLPGSGPARARVPLPAVQVEGSGGDGRAQVSG